MGGSLCGFDRFDTTGQGVGEKRERKKKKRETNGGQGFDPSPSRQSCPCWIPQALR